MKTIKYREGYKYQLAESLEIQTPVTGEKAVDDFFELRPDGMLLVRAGYAWDGASGPTFDTPASMAPSLVHDVFCQLMRDGRVGFEKWQDTVNEFFREMCIAAGMWEWRASLWHRGVEFGDAGNPDQGPGRKILEAPLGENDELF